MIKTYRFGFFPERLAGNSLVSFENTNVQNCCYFMDYLYNHDPLEQKYEAADDGGGKSHVDSA